MTETIMGEVSGTERERSMAIEAVLTHAPDIGVEQALEKFDSHLTAMESSSFICASFWPIF